MKYEESMKRLEEILGKIENSATSIEESIALYEEGVGLSAKCLEDLKTAKGKISVLQQDLNKLIESDFNMDDI